MSEASVNRLVMYCAPIGTACIGFTLQSTLQSQANATTILLYSSCNLFKDFTANSQRNNIARNSAIITC